MSIINMRIQRVIAHEVVRASELNTRNPIYSNILISLDNQSLNLLIDRIMAVISQGSHCVDLTVEDTAPGRSFNIISNMLDFNDTEFITNSRNLAAQLSNAQTSGSIKSGSAIFIQGTLYDDGTESRFIAIIKADYDRGLMERIENNEVMLEYINNIILGDSTRLMKLALFIEINRNHTTGQNQVRNTDDFSIKVFDHLMQNSTNGNASLYFYSTFLGCRIADNSSSKTKKFYEITRNFINSINTGNEDKLELYGHLISYLSDNSTIINPREFSIDYFPEDQQDSFLRECKEQGIAESFSKNTQLIKGKLRRESIRFTSNITIIALPEELHNSFCIIGPDDENEGWVKVRIRGEIENIK